MDDKINNVVSNKLTPFLPRGIISASCAPLPYKYRKEKTGTAQQPHRETTKLANVVGVMYLFCTVRGM